MSDFSIGFLVFFAWIGLAVVLVFGAALTWFHFANRHRRRNPRPGWLPREAHLRVTEPFDMPTTEHVHRQREAAARGWQ